MGKLILVRHGISDFNKRGVWTGWNNPDLAEEGFKEAEQAGEAIKDLDVDKIYSADLKRNLQTTEEIKKVLGKPNLETIVTKAFRERSYGDLAGKNKWEMKEKYGEEQFMKWRRGWDEPIPNGETLKDVYDRAAPYYDKHVLPNLEAGKNILISASGNSLRALVKHIENLPNDAVTGLEIGTGEVYVYDVCEDGKISNKEIRSVNAKRGKV